MITFLLYITSKGPNREVFLKEGIEEQEKNLEQLKAFYTEMDGMITQLNAAKAETSQMSSDTELQATSSENPPPPQVQTQVSHAEYNTNDMETMIKKLIEFCNNNNINVPTKKEGVSQKTLDEIRSENSLPAQKIVALQELAADALLAQFSKLNAIWGSLPYEMTTLETRLFMDYRVLPVVPYLWDDRALLGKDLQEKFIENLKQGKKVLDEFELELKKLQGGASSTEKPSSTKHTPKR
jgi:hypothetical protein